MAKNIVVVTSSFAEGTVSTDPLVAFLFFFSFFLLTQNIGAKGVGPKAQTGA